MIAFVFAAGLGTRLRPFTEHHPKAMVTVGDEPMIGRVLTKLRDAGIRKAYVNVHHFASEIVDFLRERDNFGLEIVISDETGLLLETGGAIVRCASKILADKEPVLIHNSDILTDFSLDDMMRTFDRSRAMAMLMVKDRESSRKLLFDRNLEMKGWRNVRENRYRPPRVQFEKGLREYAFSGVHVISEFAVRSLVDYNKALLRKDPARKTDDTGATPFSITDFYIDKCGEMIFSAYLPEGAYRWFDIGKPETLERAREAFAGKRQKL